MRMGRMTADDRDSVRANISYLGLHGAMRYAERDPRIRRLMVLTIRETSSRLLTEARRARRLAASHAVGLRKLGA